MGKKILDLLRLVDGLSFRTDEFGEWSGIKWRAPLDHFKVAYGAKLADHSKITVFDVVL